MFCQDICVVHGLRMRMRMLIAMLPILVIMASGHQLPVGNHELCAAALAKLMDVVCNRGYNTLAPKRTPHPDNSALGRLLLLLLLLSNGDGDVASGFRIKTRRQKRNLPLECCVCSCTYAELSAHCSLAK